jgi:hypothetical protein
MSAYWLFHLAQASGTGDVTFKDSWGWAVTLAVVILTGLVNYLAGASTARKELKKLEQTFVHGERAKLLEIDRVRVLTQLTELYGPLQAIRQASKLVWQKLQRVYIEVEQMPADYHFRLVDLLPDIGKHKVYGPLVDEILVLASKTEELLVSKAGLIDGEWPDSFRAYLGHVAIMRAAHAGGNPRPGEAGFMADSSFPRSLDDDIEKTLSGVKEKYDSLTKQIKQARKDVGVLV